MPRCPTQSYLFVMLALAGVLVAGCATHRADDRILKIAEQEQMAASVRLAQAMSRYCTVTTETLLARDACLLEQRFSVLGLEHQFLPASRSDRAESLPLRRKAGDD